MNKLRREKYLHNSGQIITSPLSPKQSFRWVFHSAIFIMYKNDKIMHTFVFCLGFGLIILLACFMVTSLLLATSLLWRHNGTMACQITSLTIVYSTVYSGADQRKHQSSASLSFVRVIHRGSVNSPHKWPVTRKMFPFDDVIIGESYSYPTEATIKKINA